MCHGTILLITRTVFICKISVFVLIVLIQDAANIQFCDMYGNICFENSMQNGTVAEKCDCPMECNSITYTFSLISTPFDPLKMCPTNIKDNALMKPFYESRFPHQFIRRLIDFKDNISSQERDYCKRNIQYRAEIVFRLATNTMPVTVISRRLSFFDKMSAFGEFAIRIHFIYYFSS